MTKEFDKILTDSRGIKKTLLKLEQAEKNQEEIEILIESTLSLGNELLEKIEEFKRKNPDGKGELGTGGGIDVTAGSIDLAGEASIGDSSMSSSS